MQRGVADLLEREGVEAVLCGTGFASVQFEEAGLGAPLWDRLGVPVLQVLCSGRSREAWRESSIGLGPLDLSLQVALPELDGRITTRVGAFKERTATSDALVTALHRYVPDPERLDWIAALAAAWVGLRRTPAAERRLALVLANYPTRNSRLANGVGLDTPASASLMLQWLAAAGYDLGESAELPADGDALIHRLLDGRSNDPESGHRPPLEYLPLAHYQRWYATLPEEGRRRLESVWGPPESDAGLERVTGADGGSDPAFAVHGLRFGRLALLIQPERGYERDPSLSYHSPDLPPTHAYLAQYLWLRQVFGAQVVVHVGKHGNLEWLPGKGLGLSQDCFPEWALGPMPHLYPFIVNDPGEGSQAKRRAQAVILDHLTPPLGRAGLHGDLQVLEVLLDEYWEAGQLGSGRAEGLRQRLASLLEELQLPAQGQAPWSGVWRRPMATSASSRKRRSASVCTPSARCPLPRTLAELLLCLARAPQAGQPGLTQALAQDLGLDLDPWSDPEEEPLSAADRRRLAAHAQRGAALRHAGDGVAVLEGMALALVEGALAGRDAGPSGGPRGGHPPVPGPSAPGPAAFPAGLRGGRAPFPAHGAGRWPDRRRTLRRPHPRTARSAADRAQLLQRGSARSADRSRLGSGPAQRRTAAAAPSPGGGRGPAPPGALGLGHRHHAQRR